MVIRRAKPEDAKSAARLISMAWEELAYTLAGCSNKAQVNNLLEMFFKMKGNRFSYQYVDVAEVDKKVAGMVLSFPADLSDKLNVPVEKKLPLYYKSTGDIYKCKVIPLIRSEEAMPGEYYIDAISVFPEFRNKGIGRNLLEVAKIKGKTYKMGKASLLVKVKNNKAQKLYKRLGYKSVDRLDLAGIDYIRMVKPLFAGN